MRSESTSHVRFLRPLFALLLLAAFAELASPTFAQVRSTCAPTFTTSEGSPLNLYLNANVDLAGRCRPVSDAPPLQPGDVVPGCYSGSERTPDGYTLNSQTTCTVCAEGQPGCNVYLPPPNPPPFFPYTEPPPIHAFYDPYDFRSPYDPYNPWHAYDPWDYWWPSCLAPYGEERLPYAY